MNFYVVTTSTCEDDRIVRVFSAISRQGAVRAFIDVAQDFFEPGGPAAVVEVFGPFKGPFLGMDSIEHLRSANSESQTFRVRGEVKTEWHITPGKVQ